MNLSLLVVLLASLAIVQTFAVTCDLSLSCDKCQAVTGCGFCAITGSGKCLPLEGEGNLTAMCETYKGSVIAAKQCPVVTPATCDLGLPCGDCQAKAGCGYCSIDASTNYGKCFSTATLESECAAKAGKVVAQAQCPAVVQPATCDLSLPCGDCQAKTGCGYCSIDPKINYGKCLPSSTIATECAAKSGTVIAEAQCPALNPIYPEWCVYDAKCGDCVANNKVACGFCSYNQGLSSKCMALSQFSPAQCEGMQGKMYTSQNASTCPAASSSCAYTTCDECNADPNCGFCMGVDKESGKIWSKCLLKAVPQGVTGVMSAEAYCTANSGILTPKPGEKCPVVPSTWECNSKTCGECVSNPKCSFCAGTFNGASFGVCKLTTSATEYCPTISGTLFNAESAACPNAPVVEKTQDVVVDKINEGQVTEAQLNEDINKNAPALNGFIVIVTVITQAKSEGGVSKFQTFVDVTGETEPTDADKAAVCEALKKSLSTHLQVATEAIDCTLTLKTSVKRLTSSYVADLTVGSSSGVAAAVASLALVLACLFALLQ